MPYHLGNPVNLNNDYSYNNTNAGFKRLLDFKEQDLKYSNSKWKACSIYRRTWNSKKNAGNHGNFEDIPPLSAIRIKINDWKY